MGIPFTVACVQLCADNDEAQNLAIADDLVRASAADGADLVLLPEYFSVMRPDDEELARMARTEPEEPALAHMAALARELGIWLLLGALPIKIASGKVNNRSYLLDAAGKVVTTYNKIHLFDVNLKDNERYEESKTIEPGCSLGLAATPWGILGLTVCYDLRFSYLYRTLAKAGASFISIPAAFTQTTGQAHWHVLLRARAIETGCYVFAPAQCGVRGWGRATFGHSLIVDPWGEILADGGTEPGYIIAAVDPARVAKMRAMIPSLDHDRDLPGI